MHTAPLLDKTMRDQMPFIHLPLQYRLARVQHYTTQLTDSTAACSISYKKEERTPSQSLQKQLCTIFPPLEKVVPPSPPPQLVMLITYSMKCMPISVGENSATECVSGPEQITVHTVLCIPYRGSARSRSHMGWG